MANTIDKYLVEMSFDGKKFSSGVDSTVKKINELENKLNLEKSKDSLKNLNKDINNVDFSAMDKNLQFLADRFSAIGIVGMTVINRLTNSALDFANTVIHKVITPIAEGGKNRAMNIEAARFQLLGLTKDMSKVQAYMDDANKAVTGTAFGLDSAAKAASQLAASGIESGDKMEGILKGIAGVAAMTNSTYDDTARIFTTVAGNGRVMTEQLNQMASRGLNAAAILAKSFGVTEEALREMVKGGEVSFEMFYTAMNTEFGAFAQKANETFTGSASNFRAALGRVGATFYGDFMNGARDFYNTITPVINMFNKALPPLNAWFKNMLGGTKVQDAVTGAWVDGRFGVIGEIANIVDRLDFSALNDVFGPEGVGKAGIITNVVTTLDNAFKGLWKVLSTIGKAFWDVFAPAKNLGEVFRDISKAVADWSKNLIMSDQSAVVLTGIVRGLSTVLKMAVDLFIGLAKIVFEIIGYLKPFAGVLLQIVSIFGEFVYGAGQAFKETQFFSKAMSTLHKIFGPILILIRDLVTGFADFVFGLATTSTKVDEAGNVIEGSLTPVASIAKTIFSAILSLNGAFWDFLSVIETVGKTIYKHLNPYIQNTVNWFSKLKIGSVDLGTIMKTAINSTKAWFADLDNHLTNFRESFDEFVYGLGNRAKAVIEKILDGSTTVKKVFTKLFTELKEFVDGVLDGIGSFAGSIFDKIGDSADRGFTKAKKKTEKFGEEVHETLGPVAKIGDAIKVVFDALWDIVQVVGPKIADAIQFVIENFTDFLNRVDTSKLKDLVSMKVIWDLGDGMGGLIKAGENLTKNASSMITSIKNVFNELTSGLETMQKSVKANTIETIAKSILMIVGSVIALTFFDPIEIAVSMGFITAMFGELAGVMKIMDNVSKKGDVKAYAELSLILNQITKILLGLSLSVKLLGTIPIDRMISALAGMAGMLGVLYAVIEYMRKLHKKTVESVTAKLIMLIPVLEEFAKMLMLLGVAVKIFSTIDLDEMIVGLGGIGALLGGLVLFLKYGELDKLKEESGQNLVMLAAALFVLATAVKKFAKLSWEQLIKGLGGLAAVMTMMVVAIQQLPADLESKIVNIEKLGLALTLMSVAVAVLGKMKIETLVQGLVGLAAVMGIMVVALRQMDGIESSFTGVVGLAAALALLVVPIWAFGQMDLDTIIKGIIAIAGATTVLVAAGIGAKFAGEGMKLLSIAILALGAGLGLAGGGVLAFAAGLSIMSVAGSVAFDILAAGLVSLAKSLPEVLYSVAKAVGSFFLGLADAHDDIFQGIKVIITSFVRAMAESTYEVAEMLLKLLVDGTKLLAENAGPVVANIMEFIIQILKEVAARIPEMTQYLIDIVAGIFKTLVEAFGDVTLDDVLAFAATIGGLAAIMTALSFVAGLVPGALLGLAGIGVMVGELAAILAIFGGLAQIPGLSWLVEEGGEFLGKIGYAIGNFIGSFGKAIIDNIADSLPNFGAKLSEFMVNLGPFLDGVDRLNPTTTKAVQELATAILIITAADILDAIGSFFTGGNSLEQFGKDLALFGKGLKSYADEIEGINPVAVGVSATAAGMLVDLANKLPKSGGVVQFFTGTTMSMAEFGSHLKEFGKGMKAYSNAIGDGFKAEAVQASAVAGKALVDLAKDLPKTGGLMEFIGGKQMTMSEFGRQIVEFGLGLANFSLAASMLKIEPMETAVQAGKKLTKLAESLPDTSKGGLKGAIFGNDTDLGDFGDALIEFGNGLKGLYNAVKDIDPKILEACIKAVESLTKMDLTNIDEGIAEDFVDGLQELAESNIQGFLDAFTDADLKVMVAVKQFLEYVNTYLQDEESYESTYQQGITLVDNFIKGAESAKENIVKMGRGIGDKAIKGVEDRNSNMKEAGFVFAGKFNAGIGDKNDAAYKRGQGLVDNVIKGIKSMHEKIQTTGFTFAGKFNAGLGDKYDASISRGTALAKKVIEGIKAQHNAMKDAGFTFAGKFNGGVGDKYKAAIVRGQDIANNVIKGIRSTSAASAGHHFVQGYLDGLNAKLYLAANFGSTLGARTLQSLRDALGIKSPSREAYALAEYFNEGFINGLNDGIPYSENAAKSLGDSALDGIRKSVDGLQNAIDNDMDIDITIAPVVDLTNFDESLRYMENNMSHLQDIDPSISRSQALGIAASMTQGNVTNNESTPVNTEVGKEGTKIEFNQYNNSPKALTQLEIYRNTQNQLNMMKGVIKK